MRDRRALLALMAVLVGLIALVVFIYPRGTPSGGAGRGRSFDSQDLEPPPAPAADESPSAAAPSLSSAPPVGMATHPPGGSPGPDATAFPAAVPRGAAPTPPNPQTEADKVHHMITDYHTAMGENPVGTNAEIMREVMGANPRQAKLGPPEGQTLNGRGELVDQWGTPYFFHQLSRDVMEIHSAGPDRGMGTADDIVTR